MRPCFGARVCFRAVGLLRAPVYIDPHRRCIRRQRYGRGARGRRAISPRRGQRTGVADRGPNGGGDGDFNLFKLVGIHGAAGGMFGARLFAGSAMAEERAAGGKGGDK